MPDDRRAAIRSALDQLGEESRIVLQEAARDLAAANALVEAADRRIRERRKADRIGGRRAADMQPALIGGEAMLSVSSAVLWLRRHGIDVHKNTVRHWYQSGRIRVIRAVRDSAPSHTHGSPAIEIWIPLTTLEKIADCPYCSSR